MESGEGIESLTLRALPPGPGGRWNPVKELKVYTWFSCPRCGRVYVESGEGIESSSPRRASRSASAGSMWNPVKELKVVFLDVFRYHSDRWNPVKELKGLFGMP